MGGKVEQGDEEAKDVVSGCNGARTSATQQWEQMTDFKPCSDWKFFLKNNLMMIKKLDCMGLREEDRDWWTVKRLLQTSAQRRYSLN